MQVRDVIHNIARASATLIILTVSLSACEHLRYLEPPVPIGVQPTPSLRVKVAAARECSNPAIPDHSLNSDFKYGCFCGKGYPDIKVPGDRDISQLTPRERYALAKNYYDIRPVDDIDAICQAHDVCWVINGRSEAACNRQFGDSMDRLRRAFWPAFGFNEPKTKTLEWRCARFALDLAAVTSTIFFETTSVDPFVAFSQAASRAITSPLAAAYGALFISSDSDNWPRAGERCVLSRPAAR